jgi:hypothetical protein
MLHNGSLITAIYPLQALSLSMGEGSVGAVLFLKRKEFFGFSAAASKVDSALIQITQ